jgi:prepilin-type N-terminal cleavage/methylation domain-containing protein
MLRGRLADDDGFGLVELLIAMTILVIGIMAIVAGFSSGMVALQRSSQVSTAGVLADQQMESYRRVRFAAIALDTTLFAGVDSTYKGDTAFPPSPPGTITGACAGSPTASDYYYCNPSRTTTGPDGRSYRIDSYVRWACVLPPPGTLLDTTVTPPTCTPQLAGVAKTRPVRSVTVVVRGGSPSRALIRATSMFDESTG